MKARWLIGAAVTAIVGSLAAADIDVTVATDEPFYVVGDPILVEVTAHNTFTVPVTLQWPNTCQASYIMDDVYDWKSGKFFLHIITEVTIPGQSSHTWYLGHDWGEYNLGPAMHTVVGEVVGYGLSQPVSFEVYILGDMDASGALNNNDISPFVLALVDRPAYEIRYPGIDALLRGDMDRNGYIDNNDIRLFVIALTSSAAPQAVPEPATMSLLVLGGLALLRRRSR